MSGVFLTMGNAGENVREVEVDDEYSQYTSPTEPVHWLYITYRRLSPHNALLAISIHVLGLSYSPLDQLDNT
jgi:hypothetical protein